MPHYTLLFVQKEEPRLNLPLIYISFICTEKGRILIWLICSHLYERGLISSSWCVCLLFSTFVAQNILRRFAIVSSSYNKIIVYWSAELAMHIHVLIDSFKRSRSTLFNILI